MPVIIGEKRLIARAYWMVNQRWLVIVTLVALTWLAYNLFNITMSATAIYLFAIGLIVENIITRWLLAYVKRRKMERVQRSVRVVIHFQIICDLLILTGILHFTGGIENPFFLAYFFHMVISSILLPRLYGYLYATLSVTLFGLLIYSEYLGILNHHCLCFNNIPSTTLFNDAYFVTTTFCVFVVISFILIYLSTSIGVRLRNQEEKLTLAIIQLKKNDAIKNEYVLRVTHDIKSHLAAIQTSLSVLTSGVFGKLEDKQQEFLERAYKRAEKLIKFSNNLLHLTRIRLENQVEKQTFSLSSLIKKVIADHQEDAAAKNIEITCHIDKSIDNYFGNKLSFDEVFQNLIGNAVKYTGENGKVDITAKKRLHKIRIEIKDNGIGIPQDELKNIFSEFFRGSNAKEKDFQGSGVGLSLVKEIIKRHDGMIWVENQSTGGAKFIIVLSVHD